MTVPDMLAPDVVTVAVTRVDGGLTVMKIIEAEYVRDPENKAGRLLVKEYKITDEYIDQIIAKHGWTDGLAAVSWRIVPNDFANETVDRTYRNAWKDNPELNKPDHDMRLAKEVQRIYLRKSRLAEFCRLDNELRLAEAAGDAEAKATIMLEQQKFRDVTDDPRIEAAETVDDLKKLRLDALVPETKGEKYMDKMHWKTAVKLLNEKDKIGG